MKKHERTVGSELLLSVLQRQTQKDVAAGLGVSQSILSRWASGQARPSAKARDMLQVGYGIPAVSWTVPACIKGNSRSAIVELVEVVKALEKIVNRMLVSSAE